MAGRATQYLDRARTVEGRVMTVVRGTFVEFARPIMTPLRFLVFRAAMLTVGRVPAAARWMKNLLVRVLITKRPAVQLQHERTITLEPGELHIEDRISGPDLTRLRSLWRGHLFTTVHMGSSRYFVPQELHAVDQSGGLEPIELAPGSPAVISHRRPFPD
jgi:hypothetical protein